METCQLRAYSIPFTMSNRKIVLKVPAAFKIHTHSHKNTLTWSSKGKSVSCPSKQGQTTSYLFQYESAYRIGRYMQRFLLRRPSLSTCLFFLIEVQCDQGRNQTPSAILQAGTLQTKEMLVDMEKHRQPHSLKEF